MSKWFRLAAAIAMLGLVMACLTPAAAVVPTATSAPIPVTCGDCHSCANRQERQERYAANA